jgi:hypothetical protein
MPNPDPNSSVASFPSNTADLKFDPGPGPCGALPPVPKTEYWEKQFIVRLQPSAVTKTGFSPAGLRVLEMLQSQGKFTVESMMSCWEVSNSISTGKAPWLITMAPNVEKRAEVFDNPLLVGWISAAEVGDGKWVGALSNTVGAAGGGVFKYRLDLSWMSVGGKFSLYWAADNNATWSIVNGAFSPESDLGGGTSEFHFSKPSGAPRHISGTFGANASLVVVVRNQAGGPNPCGLLVSGVAGAYPDLRAPMPNYGPKLKLEPPAGVGQQPKISLDTPGPNPVGPYLSEHAQEALRCLLVEFENEPHPELLRCLRSAPGVKYVDRIPVVRIGPSTVEPDPITGGGPVGNPAMPAMSLMAVETTKASGPTVEPEAYLSTIGRIEKGKTTEYNKNPAACNLAIIDGAFGSVARDHGKGVWNVAYRCLYGIDPKSGGPFQFAVKDLAKSELKKGIVSPSLYFNALRNIADRPSKEPRIRVVNISRGSSDWTRLEYELLSKLEKLQVVVVAAAGQDSQLWMVDFPAAFPDVLSIGSLDTSVSPPIQYETMNSNYNMDNLRCLDTKDSDGCALDVVGPARNIRVGEEGGSKYRDSGNSFAAPMVAALCSEIAANFGDLSAADIRKAVRESCGVPRPEEARSGVSQNTLWEPLKKIRFGRGLFHWGAAMKRAGELNEIKKKGG